MALSIRCIFVVVVAVAVAGCSDEGSGVPNQPGREDAGADVASNNGGDTGSGADAEADGSTSAGCDGPIAVDQTFVVDAAGASGQFYARAAFDGQSVWVVYNRPAAESESGSDIMLVQLACDGTPRLGPMQISEVADDDTSNYQPAIASHGGVTFVVWVAQENGLNPKAILFRSFQQDGTALQPSALNVTPTGDVDPIAETIWELDLAALPDGDAVFVGSSGLFGTRQVVMQRFNQDGVTVGDAVFPFLNKTLNQTRPSVAANADGDITLSWTQNRLENTDTGTAALPEMTVVTTVANGLSNATPIPPLEAGPGGQPNPIARLAKEPGPSGEVFVVFQETASSVSDIHVRDANDLANSVATFGADGENNFRPSIAGSSTGGAVAWYSYTQSPARGTVRVSSLNAGDSLSAGASVDIPMASNGIPPFGPAITSAGGNLYFVAWSEGASAREARVMGRFVSF